MNKLSQIKVLLIYALVYCYMIISLVSTVIVGYLLYSGRLF